jgi:hypothetical protein
MPRKAFLLRIDPGVLAEVQRWADEDLRSLNGQIEYLLRQALARRGKQMPEGSEKKKGEREGQAGESPPGPARGSPRSEQ